MTDFENILLVKLRAIGDSVLTLPSLAELRKGFPRARITLLLPEHSVGLLAADTRADEAIAYPRARLRSLADHTEFYQSLQARHFDLAVCLHASLRTALIAWMSGAEARVVRNHSGPDWLSSIRAREAKEPKSIIERDFDALRALGLKPKDTLPKLMLSTAAKREATALAKRAKLGKGLSVLLFPGAGKPEKRWPMERFAALKQALDKKGVRSAWMLGPGEAGPAGALRVGDLLTLGALAAHAGYAIGNDSGPRHIAAASGARTLTLFGPEALREWHPYRREDGHWALLGAQRRVDHLSLDEVKNSVSLWLKK